MPLTIPPLFPSPSSSFLALIPPTMPSLAPAPILVTNLESYSLRAVLLNVWQVRKMTETSQVLGLLLYVRTLINPEASSVQYGGPIYPSNP